MGVDALRQPGNGLRDLGLVSEVTGSNQKGTATNAVRSVANSKSLLGREVGNLAVLLTVASVSVKHDASHLSLGCLRQASDGRDHDGCALRVATTHNDSIWAFRGGEVEHFHCLAVGSGAGAVSGKGVGTKTGCVGSSNTLAGYLAWEFPFEATASRRTKGRALVDRNPSARETIACLIRCCYRVDAYHVTHFGGAASVDECDLFAAAGLQVVRSHAAKLSALQAGGNGGDGGGEQRDDCSELHVCG